MKTLLDPQKTLFLFIDIQERILQAMALKSDVVKNANILLKGAAVLGCKSIITEQYPKGLGSTDASIQFDASSVLVMEKASFSVFAQEEIAAKIKESGATTLVICGIESHVCVLQSAIHALELGYEVWLAADAMSSRTVQNHQNAVEFIRDAGAKVSNTETILFGGLLDSKDPRFKGISNAVK